MANEIISYTEMCKREGAKLQRAMNFQVGGNHSVILMSVQPDTASQDRIENNGETLIVEGHDINKRYCKFPNLDDQPRTLPSGKLTENGNFEKAALAVKKGGDPERVRVYEKIKKGIWSYNGVFHLVDSWTERDKHRLVFKFKLVAVEGDEDFTKSVKKDIPHGRIIPPSVKQEVWKRDGGKCVLCGAKDNLHIEHILSDSKGGASITAENVQLLCKRHKLKKSNNVE